MCTTFCFYHLCGHTHSITTFPCTYTPTPLKSHPLPEDEVLFPSPGSIYRPQDCLLDSADSPEEIRLFPTLCARCEQVGVISEWLDRTPGGRFDVIRAWNKAHRPALCKQPTLESEVAELESFDDVESDTGSDATTVDSEKTAFADEQSATTLIDSSPRTKPARRNRTNMSSLRERMVALKARLRERIAELKK